MYAKVSHGFGTYGQQFALFFLLAAWLGFLSQFILIGAVFNKMRLGAPQSEGIVASPESSSREHTNPHAAINAQRARGNAPTGGDPVAAAVAIEPQPEPQRPTPRQARVALGLCMAVAAAGTAALRLRRHRNRLMGAANK